MPQFSSLTPPADGTAIVRRNDAWVVPSDPIVPFIEGDGTGPDIWRASVRVLDAAVDLARQMEGATELRTSEFADAMIANM